MANDRYEDRYCAFIDILGFSDLVAELKNDPTRFVDVQQLLRKIHEPQRVEVSPIRRDEPDFQAQSISDAVAISTKCNPIGLISLIGAVGQLVRSLLREGYFTRGAICKGPLYHDDKTVFGEALIRAYRLESQVVKYPRIMITKDVVDAASALGYGGSLARHLVQADDGPHFLHVLLPLFEKLERLKKTPSSIADDAPKVEEPDFSFYEEIRARIMQRFGESVDNPRHFEKVQWFAGYWNRSIKGVDIRSNVGRIEGPGIHRPMPVFWDSEF